MESKRAEHKQIVIDNGGSEFGKKFHAQRVVAAKEIIEKAESFVLIANDGNNTQCVSALRNSHILYLLIGADKWKDEIMEAVRKGMLRQFTD